MVQNINRHIVLRKNMNKATGTTSPPEIRPDVTLGPFRLPDLDIVRSWISDDRVDRCTSWDAGKSREEALSFLKRRWVRAIYVGGHHRPVGFVYASRPTGENSCRAEVEGVLAPKFWGRDVGVTALKLAAQELLEWSEVHRVEAMVTNGSEASEEMLQKGGVQKDGVLGNYVFKGRKPLDKVLYSYLRRHFPSSEIIHPTYMGRCQIPVLPICELSEEEEEE